MKDKNKRKKYLLIVGILLAVFVVIGSSFAYYNASITKVNETETNINTIVLGAGECNDVVMECLNVVPGDKCTKEFSITNTNANTPLVANLYMRNIRNGFASDLNDLVYVLKDKDTGETIVTETVIPGSQAEEYYLKENITIPGNTTKTYQFIVEYKYLNVSQNSFQGKEFKAGFCADTKQFECNKPCNGACPSVGDIVTGSENECAEKVEKVTKVDTINSTYCTVEVDNPYCEPEDTPNPDETQQECEERMSTKKVYGTEVAIHHDIYYADQNKYENGLNERYVTYCKPWKKGNSYGVKYCTTSNGKKNCKNVEGTSSCSYQNAMIDLEYTSIKKQTKVEDFADQNNGNWHIQTYCQTAAKKTNWPGNGSGIYYCNTDATKLHDWYATSTSSVNDINVTESCNQTVGWKPSYYAYGDYNSPDALIPSNNTEPPINKKAYAAMDTSGNFGVCVNRGGQQHCFKTDDWDTGWSHAQQVFSDCSVYWDWNDEYIEFNCEDGFYGALERSINNIYQEVSIGNTNDGSYCSTNYDDSVSCS